MKVPSKVIRSEKKRHVCLNDRVLQELQPGGTLRPGVTLQYHLLVVVVKHSCAIWEAHIEYFLAGVKFSTLNTNNAYSAYYG